MKWQTWHRWLAWLAAVQMLLWLISGLSLSLLPSDWLSANKDRSTPTRVMAEQPLADITPLLNQFSQSLQGLETRHHLPFTVYRVTTHEGVFWFRADTLAPLRLTSAQISAQASASYTGTSPLSAPRFLNSPPTGIKTSRLYQVNAGHTRIYVNADSGEVLPHQHPGTELKQLLLMIHFMDYYPDNGVGFNALPIQIMALLALCMGVSGVFTLIAKCLQGTLTLPPLTSWPGFKTGKPKVWLYGANADMTAEPIAVFSGRGTLLQTLNTKSQILRTQCGGGGNCGMCRLRWLEHAPRPTDADKQALSEAMLEEGIRLGCQHKVADTKVALATPAQQRFWQKQQDRSPTGEEEVER